MEGGTVTNDAPPSHLVVVGSSAGGIDALSRLVSGLPKSFPAPLVVAQHLDPRTASHLGEILARHSALPVVTVSDRAALEPGHVYLVPANRNVEITDHQVRLLRNNRQTGPHPSIDLLFESAAKVFGEQLIAVVLSGTGSDGAAGARVAHEAGGTIIIQNPETAAFPGMPRSLPAAIVDISADAERIGGILNDLITGVVPEEPHEERAMRSLLEALKARYGVDFASYRRPTIARRLQRRLTATQTETIEDYYQYLQDHPDEEQRLLSSFLIKVTDFFRDQRAFAYLQERVLPGLMERARSRDEGLRIWSAGCATGEEAYSIALLAAELRANADQVPVRIFATDLDASAVAFARRGVYPASALKNVPSELREQYFTDIDGEYEIDKSIRGMMLFGQHDLSQMPAFPHLDLLICRNVLMYFTAELQRRVLESFAFALRHGGYLMLGSAETTRPLTEFFSVEQSAHKIYRRTGGTAVFTPSPFSSASTWMQRRTAITELPARVFNPALAEPPVRTESLRLAHLPVGVVVVDHQYDIASINPAARRLLGIHGMALNEDFVHLLSPPLAAPLRAAIDQVFSDGQPTKIDELLAAQPELGERHLNLVFAADHDADMAVGNPPRVLISITDITDVVVSRRRVEDAYVVQESEVERLSQLTQRLEDTNRRLLIANEELTIHEEALRASNEESLVASAEAQAATEELETYAEELQATTEELETLNEELKATVEELTVSNADLDARAQELTIERQASEERRAQLAAILTSLPVGVVVVNRGGHPILTNVVYDEITRSEDLGSVNMRDEEGRPLAANASPLARAAKGETFSMELTVTLPDRGGDRRFEAYGRPIETMREDGARGVVVFRDISEHILLRAGQEFAGLATHELRSPLSAARAYLELLASIISSDESAEQRGYLLSHALIAVTRLGDRIADLGDVQSVEAGKLRLSMEAIDIVPLLSQSVEVARVMTQGQTIELESEPGPILVRADPHRLEQVLDNLLSNAITYAPDTKTIKVCLRQNGSQVEIDVQDHGPGIRAADLPHVFSRYFQVQRASPRSRGLGLGLYLAKEIMDAHGGTISVDSVEGEGTTFTIRLDVAKQ